MKGTSWTVSRPLPVSVTERCRQWTGVYWNEDGNIYAQAVPEYLFEFESCEETNEKQLDGRLSRKDYGISNRDPGDEINRILRLPLDFANKCECTNANAADKPTLEILTKMRHILISHGH